MGSAATALSPVPGFRDELRRLGGGDAARCFQCATCCSVCELSTAHAAFPRRLVLWAQWGLVDRLAADPAIWLCHQCNDCTARCPRDAAPGETLQALRAVVIEQLGSPRWAARLVGRARSTWPLLIGAPIAFWAAFVGVVNGFAVPRTPLAYGDVVPTWMIYAVFLPAAAFALWASAAGARRAWAAWGGAPGASGLVSGLAAVALEILAHRRFERCGVARPRRPGHLLLVLGFLGALLTTGLLGIAMDVFGVRTPLATTHPIKLAGNASAALLVAGVGLLSANRLRREIAGRTAAFDGFFLALVAAVVLSGLGAELARLHLAPPVALAVYVAHLGAVLSLFLTFPFSKFAHALYRTLAMAHERLASERRQS